MQDRTLKSKNNGMSNAARCNYLRFVIKPVRHSTSLFAGNRGDGDSDLAENDAPTFRGPSRGRRGRGGLHSGRQLPSFQKDHDHRPTVHQDSYTDYPANFTTLSALYPASEFIMPYVTHSLGPAAFVTSSLRGPPLIRHAGIPYVPTAENAVVVEMVKKQM